MIYLAIIIGPALLIILGYYLVYRNAERLVLWLLEEHTTKETVQIHQGDYNIVTRRGYAFPSGFTLWIDEDLS